MSAKVPIEQQIAALSAQVNQLSDDIKNGFVKNKCSSSNLTTGVSSTKDLCAEINQLIRTVVEEEENKIRVIYSNNPDLFEVWITQHKQALLTLPKILSEITSMNNKILRLESQLSNHAAQPLSKLIKWNSFENPYFISTIILLELIGLFVIFRCI